MTKDPRVYLAHILECSERIERFTRGGRENFFREVLIQDAVIRNLEIIGEAAKRVDDDYRATHPQIPWRGMTALRDVLIHQYEGVDLGKVWAVVERNLPQLKQAIKEILPPLEQLERELAGETGDAIC
jgi:uncharacterized protein with HEPN domain